MPRIPNPQISFADLQLQMQGVTLDPLLSAISDFLSQHGALVEKVRQDLQRGLKNPETGRAGITPEQVLRSLSLMRIKNWDLRELRERIADGYTLRLFTRFFSQQVPQHDAFNRAFNRLTPETMQALNAAIVQAAVMMGLEDGTQLRTDTTVVQTDIHFPTDSTLLCDSVRVVTRLATRLNKKLRDGSRFIRRTRRARRRMQEIERMTARERQDAAHRPKYRDLIGVTQDVVQRAREVLKKGKKARAVDPADVVLIESLSREIQRYTDLADRVISQTQRRLFLQETVPTQEKVYSIFETHTNLIMRGKLRTPLEFGHKILLAESRNGLISEYRVLDGNPPDQVHVVPTLRRHKASFRRPPKLFAGDRGFHSDANVKACRRARVGLECIPQRGGKKTAQREAYEKSPAFKAGQRFRVGIEGRISVLFRGRGMKRCRTEGRQRFEVFVGAAVLANNLLAIARLLADTTRHEKVA